MRSATTALFLGSAGLLPADEVVLLPAADTAIYAGSGERDYNAGRSPLIPSGARGIMADEAPVRILIRYDLAAAIPPGATITSARATVFVEETPAGTRGASDFGFHRMLVPWIEGEAIAGRPGGAPASAGEPTWNNRAHPSSPWGAPGGQPGTDFAETPGATRPFPSGSSVDFTAAFDFNDPGIAELQAMLDNPSANYGWMFKSDDEETPKTARLFVSKDVLTQDAPTLAKRPTLTVTFDPPAANTDPPADFSLEFAPGGSRSLRFTREAGVGYRIESNLSLDAGGWGEFQTFPPSSSGGTETVPVTGPLPARQFFRITAQ